VEKGSNQNYEKPKEHWQAAEPEVGYRYGSRVGGTKDGT